MEIYLEKNDKKLKVEAKTVKDLFKKLKINSTTVIVSVNDELVTGDYKLNKKDKVKIIPVVSGG